MATPFFNIVVFKPDVGAGTLMDKAFETIVKTTMLDRFGKVVAKSKNTKVKSGFSVDSRKRSLRLFPMHLSASKSRRGAASVGEPKTARTSLSSNCFRSPAMRHSRMRRKRSCWRAGSLRWRATNSDTPWVSPRIREKA
jgi:hypothetical protein